MLRFGNITEIDVAKGYARVTFLDDGIVSDWLQVITVGALNNKFFHTFDVNEAVACLMGENSDEGVILGAIFNNGTPPDGGNKDVVRVKFPDNSSIEYNRSTHEYSLDIKGKINIKSDSEVNIETTTANVTAQTAAVDATLVTVDAEAVSVESSTVDVTAATVSITAVTGITGNTTVTGNLTVAGTVTAAVAVSTPVLGGGGVSISAGNLIVDNNVTVTGNVDVDGAITADGDITAGTIALKTHVHAGVTTGAGSTAVPTP